MKIRKSILKELVREVLEEQVLSEGALRTPTDLWSQMSGKHSTKFEKYYNSKDLGGRGSYEEYSTVPIALVFRYLKLTTKDLLRLEKKAGEHYLIVDEDDRTFSIGVN